ncbi:MAG: hypothetical protein J7L15_03750 [Clostridiales bacterium]|nr:hypothetical protein [Clostridiales bacterium]
MFEIIVGIFIITNTCLQLFWFHWSRSVEQRKHFTDSEAAVVEIDLIDSIQAYVDARVENEITIKKRDQEWSEFLSKTPRASEAPSAFTISEEDNVDLNAHLEKNKEGKYDHSQIDGVLDSMFQSTESQKDS